MLSKQQIFYSVLDVLVDNFFDMTIKIKTDIKDYDPYIVKDIRKEISKDEDNFYIKISSEISKYDKQIKSRDIDFVINQIDDLKVYVPKGKIYTNNVLNNIDYMKIIPKKLSIDDLNDTWDLIDNLCDNLYDSVDLIERIDK